LLCADWGFAAQTAWFGGLKIPVAGEPREVLNIEIWERGAGYTLASGTSSTAAAAVAYKLGHCSHDILVHMPGGRIHIQFSNGFFATMTGPVTKVCEGVMAREMFEADFWS
jgi:diaminopimelate epimerase